MADKGLLGQGKWRSPSQRMPVRKLNNQGGENENCVVVKRCATAKIDDASKDRNAVPQDQAHREQFGSERHCVPE